MFTEKRKRKQYERTALIDAYEEVKAKKLSITAAALKYNIPRTTLSDHVNGRIQGFKRPGIDRMHTEEEETCLGDYISYMQRHFMPLRRDDIRGTVLVGEPSILNLVRNKECRIMIRICKVTITKVPPLVVERLSTDIDWLVV